MTDGECMCLAGFVLGFCSAFLTLGVVWSMVDAVRAFREGRDE